VESGASLGTGGLSGSLPSATEHAVYQIEQAKAPKQLPGPMTALLPAALAPPAVFRSGPFTFPNNRESRAVDDEMDGSRGRDAPELHIELPTPPRERSVVRSLEIGAHQGQDRPQEVLRLAQWRAEDEPERQRGLDHQIREELLSAGCRPDGTGHQVSLASAESHSVTSPRWTSARSYSCPFPTRYVVLTFGCTCDVMV